jgi:hypothetical protein
MYKSVFAYTTATRSVTSATPRADTRIYRMWSTKLLTVRSLVKKGNEIQRYWRLYELLSR